MTLITRIIFVTMLFSIYPDNIVIGGDASYTGPDDEKAVMAAEKAVGQLGKNRGAILINYRSVGIDYKSIGIVGLASTISGKSIEVEETLRDLNAKKVDMEIQISLSGDVLFDFDKWGIRPEAEEPLAKIARVVTELKKNNMTIEGHTDSKGSDSYNLNLSQKRADSVKKWFLEEGGLSQVTFATKGYGESKPVASNTKSDGSDNPEGRAKNRRVEIRLKK